VLPLAAVAVLVALALFSRSTLHGSLFVRFVLRIPRVGVSLEGCLVGVQL
jgi:hypothetical protein